MMAHEEELQVLRLLHSLSEKLLRTQDELMMGPYQQLHGRICAVLGMVVTGEDEMHLKLEQES
ncbi:MULTISPECIES: hypothetical protein [Polaromonas]|uniref:Uncharacterized protein n=1 Tax=Polaromonas aquatica TaxID=332657 RepID=A0ABW1U3U6_9BURK